MHNFQKVVVLGLGYIGLPTAALIASRGMKVLGVDTKEDVVKTVASGAIHIAEPDLDGLVQKVVANGMLSAASKPEPADVFIIAVPTPIDASWRSRRHRSTASPCRDPATTKMTSGSAPTRTSSVCAPSKVRNTR